MKKASLISVRSLDMLLDTMCNTFGGVCFIALMVAIMSAALPPEDAGSEANDNEQMAVNKEKSMLMRTRDELKAAIATQKSFVDMNATGGERVLSEQLLMECVTSNVAVIARLRSEKAELEDKLAKLTTDVDYSRKEAMRLRRLLNDLDEKLGKVGGSKSRAVRTPVERDLDGYRPLDVWIHAGRMYCLWKDSHVDYKTSIGNAGKEWEYRIIPNAGFSISEAFFNSPEYREVIGMLAGKMYMRIFCDSVSFAQLCNFRDDLIKRRKMYNWYVCDNQVMHFVEGRDGKVQ